MFERLAHEYSMRGCDVQVLSLDTYHAGILATPNIARKSGIPITFLPMIAMGTFRFRRLTILTVPSLPGIRLTLRLLRGQAWDAVHIHGVPLTPWCDIVIILARLRGIRVVATVHLVDPQVESTVSLLRVAHKLWLYLQRALYRHVSCITGVSTHVMKQMASAGLKSRNDIVVPLAGPDPEELMPPVSTKLGLEPLGLVDHSFALTFGSIIPRKGQELLVAAVSRLVAEKELPAGFRFVIAGSDLSTGFSEHIVELIRKLNLTDRVLVLDGVDVATRDVLYRGCAFVILPSLDEGSPMVMWEGMTRGLPIIASDIPPVREAMGPSLSLLLFTSGDLGALSRSIVQLLCDRNLREEIGKNARLRAKQMPSWASVVNTYMAALLPHLDSRDTIDRPALEP